jgi:hypothetical protein
MAARNPIGPPYENLRTKATGGGVEFTRERFVAWRRESDSRRRCGYCGIDGEQLYVMNVLNGMM